jgi:glycine/D-amino acid oxidase-like deaminating enzyme
MPILKSMSGKNGRVLAEFIAGQTPSIDLSPYSIRRFIKK